MGIFYGLNFVPILYYYYILNDQINGVPQEA